MFLDVYTVSYDADDVRLQRLLFSIMSNNPGHINANWSRKMVTADRYNTDLPNSNKKRRHLCAFFHYNVVPKLFCKAKSISPIREPFLRRDNSISISIILESP